jgi:hypothetical protein
MASRRASSLIEMPVAELASLSMLRMRLVWGARGRKFESCHPGAPTLLGRSALERTEAGLGHKVGMCGNRSQRQGHFLRGLRAFLPDKRNAHCRSSF